MNLTNFDYCIFRVEVSMCHNVSQYVYDHIYLIIYVYDIHTYVYDHIHPYVYVCDHICIWLWTETQKRMQAVVPCGSYCTLEIPKIYCDIEPHPDAPIGAWKSLDASSGLHRASNPQY